MIEGSNLQKFLNGLPHKIHFATVNFFLYDNNHITGILNKRIITAITDGQAL